MNPPQISIFPNSDRRCINHWVSWHPPVNGKKTIVVTSLKSSGIWSLWGGLGGGGEKMDISEFHLASFFFFFSPMRATWIFWMEAQNSAMIGVNLTFNGSAAFPSTQLTTPLDGFFYNRPSRQYQIKAWPDYFSNLGSAPMKNLTRCTTKMCLMHFPWNPGTIEANSNRRDLHSTYTNSYTNFAPHQES